MSIELQKASLSKRIAAALLDFMLLVIILTGAATVFANISGYNTNANTMQAREKHFETEYGIVFRISEEEYNKYSQQQRENYKAAEKALREDQEYIVAWYKQFNLILLITTFSILVAVFVVEFLIPLWLKNGQTAGKKVFNLGLVREDGVQITTLQLFIRSVLGKYTIETMIPVYVFIMVYFQIANIVSLAILAALLIGQVICLIVTRQNAAIHDLLARTAVIDLPSQRIFKSSDELLAFTKKIHAERANRSDYK